MEDVKQALSFFWQTQTLV